MPYLHDELDADRRWIAAAFREMRLARGLTQERAAEEADLQKAATISEFENNASRIPPPWTRQRLYAAYEVADARRGEVEARIARYQEREGELQFLTLRGKPPTSVGPLFGREGEVRATLRLLCEGDTRLVTITGVGGVGKTRLATAVAVAYAREVRRQSVFVDLGEVRHREGLAYEAELQREIARALDLAAEPGGSLADRIAAALRRARLLVVDNLEHMLPALPYLAALCSSVPSLRILITSRDRPEAPDQQVVLLDPLPLPGARDHPAGAGELVANPAVALLIDRMRRLRPDFLPSGGDAAALAAICRDLDGLPLALELAAPHCVDLPLEVAAGKLRRRLAALRDPVGVRPARHRSLQAALDWSYELLSPEDQLLFARLAICAGADWEAVRQLGTLGGKDLDVAERIRRLCRGNLVQFQDGRHGGKRYRMLNLVREYALERLAAGPDHEVTRRWHAAYYSAVVDQLGVAGRGEERRIALERLDDELENAYELLERAEGEGPTNRELQIARRLSIYLLDRGYLHDAADWLRRRLPAARHPAPRAALLLNLAEVEAWRGSYAEALRLCDDVLDQLYALYFLERVIVYSTAADALRLGGAVRFIQGELTDARERFERSLGYSRRVGDRAGEAKTLDHLSRLLLETGDLDRARQHAESALDIAVVAGHDLLLAHVRRTCAAVAACRGDSAQALEHLAEARALADANGDTTIGVACDFTRAIVARQRGDHRLAAELLTAVLRHCRQREDGYDTRFVLEELAHLAVARGRPEHAVRLYGAAAALRERLQLPRLPPSPGNRAAHEQRQRELRALIGAEAYERLRVEGGRAPLDRIVAEALTAAQEGG